MTVFIDISSAYRCGAHWATRCKPTSRASPISFSRDGTAVFVDARPPQDFLADSVACAVNIQPSEATAANDDGRLPLWDKGARVVVFADDPHLARKLPPKSPRRPIGAAAISAGPSRILESSRLRIHSWRRCHDDMHRGEN